MVKVAHFISTSGLYGAERWILALLNHLKGIDTLLVCSNFDDPSLLDEAKKLKIKTRVLSVNGNFDVSDYLQKLSKLLREENVDILHTHGYKADILGLFAAKRSNIKVISTPHGWSKGAGLKVMVYEALDRFFLRFFDLVVPHTTALKKSLRHIKKLKLINNFIDLKTLPKPRVGDYSLITYIGQLIERKRVQDIISALRYTKETRLQIIGDGPKKPYLKKLVKKLNLQKRVSFLGFRKDRLKLLNKSQILVLTSSIDWIPRVLMEAMALEKVVIGTDIKGIRFLIKNNHTGLLVPLKKPRRIAEAIDSIKGDPSKAREMAKNARFLIQNQFSADRAAGEYEKLYKRLL